MDLRWEGSSLDSSAQRADPGVRCGGRRSLKRSETARRRRRRPSTGRGGVENHGFASRQPRISARWPACRCPDREIQGAVEWPGSAAKALMFPIPPFSSLAGEDLRWRATVPDSPDRDSPGRIGDDAVVAAPLPSGFGVRLRRWRQAKGLSLRAAADRLEVAFSYLQKLETGARARPPSIALLQRTAPVYGQSPASVAAAVRGEILDAPLGRHPVDRAFALRMTQLALRAGRSGPRMARLVFTPAEAAVGRVRPEAQDPTPGTRSAIPGSGRQRGRADDHRAGEHTLAWHRH